MGKKIVIYICGYLLIGICQSLWAGDQKPTSSQVKALDALSSISEEKVNITWSNAGTPSFLTGKFVVEREGKATSEVALSFLNQHRKLFRLKDALQEFKVSKVEKDDINFEHVRLKQYYLEVPVYGGNLIVHFNPEGKITTVNGSYLPGINISTTPAISVEQAIAIAMQDLNVDSKYYQGEGETRLEVYPFEGSYFLVWHTVLLVRGPEPGNWEYFVDAYNGKIAHRFNSLMFFTNTTHQK